MTGKKEALHECRQATRPCQQVWLVTDFKKDADGGYSATRRPISKVNIDSELLGIVCCDVGVYIGWDKGPWNCS